MDTPIFDALWAKYNATPIFDQLEREYEEKKYLELVEPYKYPLNDQRVFSPEEFVEMMTRNEILSIEKIRKLFGWREEPDMSQLFPDTPDADMTLESRFRYANLVRDVLAKQNKEKPLMNTWQRLVNEFREAFDLPLSPIPRTLSPEEAELHIKMIRREFEEEFVPAFETQDLVEMYDAGIDVIVYVIGALSHAGFDIDPGFKEVMKNNMSKLGPDGKPIRSRGEELDGEPVGKVLKPEGFVPVNLEPIINEQFRFGPEDTTVYRTKGLPLTLGEGGPKIGTADVVMDHNGVMTIDATVDDVDVLPVLEAVSISDVYIPEDDPLEVAEDRELIQTYADENVIAEPQEQDWRPPAMPYIPHNPNTTEDQIDHGGWEDR